MDTGIGGILEREGHNFTNLDWTSYDTIEIPTTLVFTFSAYTDLILNMFIILKFQFYFSKGSSISKYIIVCIFYITFIILIQLKDIYKL